MQIHCSPNISSPTNLDFLYSTKYIRRAGIIPFLIDTTGETYILLGLSKEENPVWADLGGRVEENETTIETAIREFKEESRSVLPIDMSRVTKILITGTHQPDQVILFVQVDPTRYNVGINDMFLSTVPKTKYEDEMIELRWIPFDIFVRMDPKTLSISMREVQTTLNSF